MTREARAARHIGRVLIGSASLDEALAEGAAGIISFGLCGALHPALRPGDLVLGAAVRCGDARVKTDDEWTGRIARALPEATLGEIAGSKVIVAGAAEKAALHRATGAIAVDMESHTVATAAARSSLPFVVLRAVSDGAEADLPRAAQAGFRRDGGVNVGAVIGALAARPGELLALLRTASDAASAFWALDHAASRPGAPWFPAKAR